MALLKLQHHRLFSFAISAGLVVILIVFARNPIFRILVPVLVAYLFAVSFYTVRYLKSIDQLNWWVVLRNLLVFCAWIGLFFLIPNAVIRNLFLLAGLPALYYFQVTVGNTGEQLLFNELVVSAFGLFLLFTALAEYFPNLGSSYVGVCFVMTALLCRATYELTPSTQRVKWLGSIIIALGVAEIFWALSFLPFHYSVLGFIMFVLFYAFWSLYYYYQFNYLTWRKIQFHIGLSALFIIIVLLTTPWGIIS